MSLKILAASQLAAVDAATITRQAITSLDLMERASQAMTAAIIPLLPAGQPVLVLAGPGNNGGDALVAARLLHQQGHGVSVFILPSDKYSPDHQANRERLPTGVTQLPDFEAVKDLLQQPVAVIDGLYGSGLSRPLSGEAVALVQAVNQSGQTVISLDLPSGLSADQPYRRNGTIVQATHTLTLQCPKLNLLLPDTGPFAVDWQVLDIGLDAEALDSQSSSFFLLEEKDLAFVHQPRARFSHKGTYGHLLLVGGSEGKAGAVQLSARAALASGVGLLTILAPRPCHLPLQTAVPEAMISMAPEGDRSFEFIRQEKLPKYNALAIGPGLGTETSASSAINLLLNRDRSPLVLDADGLNLLAKRLDWYPLLRGRAVLTPHVGELARLCGPADSAHHRLNQARELAFRHDLVVVLKGAYSATCLPSGQVYFNPTGNPGLAKGGSGDTLTGMIGALLAQGHSPTEAALAGVYYHGLAADQAAQRHGMRAMQPSDVIEALRQGIW